jgi:hypothetical protein
MRPAARVGNPFTGWYLFATDERTAADTIVAGVGYGSAGAIPPVRPGRTVALSASLGPVAGPPVPWFTILRPARPIGGQVLVARVRCAVRCRVWLTVEGRRYGYSASPRVRGTALVGVRRGRLTRGPLLAWVHIDDGPTVAAHTRLP